MQFVVIWFGRVALRVRGLRFKLGLVFGWLLCVQRYDYSLRSQPEVLMRRA